MRTAPLRMMQSWSSAVPSRTACSPWRRRCRRPSSASRSRSALASIWKCVLVPSALRMRSYSRRLSMNVSPWTFCGVFSLDCPGGRNRPGGRAPPPSIIWWMNPPRDQDTLGALHRPVSDQHEIALPVMLERALDMLDSALLIVDDEGRVEYRNRVASALLASGQGGLALARGVLTATARQLRERLAEAIRLACVDLEPSGLCLPQPGVAPDRWLRLVVTPIWFGSSGGRAAIWVLNTASPGMPSEELLGA